MRAVDTSATTLAVTWTPIPYTADGGSYEVLYLPASSGLFVSAGHTTDKAATGFTITGLNPGDTYQVVVRTVTPAHGAQQNTLTSAASDPCEPDEPRSTADRS